MCAGCCCANAATALDHDGIGAIVLVAPEWPIWCAISPTKLGIPVIDGVAAAVPVRGGAGRAGIEDLETWRSGISDCEGADADLIARSTQDVIARLDRANPVFQRAGD